METAIFANGFHRDEGDLCLEWKAYDFGLRRVDLCHIAKPLNVPVQEATSLSMSITSVSVFLISASISCNGLGGTYL